MIAILPSSINNFTEFDTLSTYRTLYRYMFMLYTYFKSFIWRFKGTFFYLNILSLMCLKSFLGANLKELDTHKGEGKQRFYKERQRKDRAGKKATKQTSLCGLKRLIQPRKHALPSRAQRRMPRGMPQREKQRCTYGGCRPAWTERTARWTSSNEAPWSRSRRGLRGR